MALLALAGCDGGEGETSDEALGESECELAVELAGELSWSGADAPACVIPFAGDTGITMVYSAIDDALVDRLELELEEITEGALGAFPAAVTIFAEDGRAWTSAGCTVDITAHALEGEDDFSRMYKVTGSGSCAEPASPAGGGAAAEVTISAFELRFPARW